MGSLLEQTQDEGFSTELARKFDGVAFKPEDSVVTRRVGVQTCIEWVKMLETIGWFEHTNDWDFEYRIEMVDGLQASAHAGSIYLWSEKDGPDWDIVALDKEVHHAGTHLSTHLGVLPDELNFEENDGPYWSEFFEITREVRIPLGLIAKIEVVEL